MPFKVQIFFEYALFVTSEDAYNKVQIYRRAKYKRYNLKFNITIFSHIYS
jgi:hypothetical protein